MTKKSIEQINSGLMKTPVAIVGIASIFPQSENKETFWNNIINEVDSITDVPESRWNIDDFYHPDKKIPDKSYSKRGGFIPDIDFNPLDFGLPPNILELTDVSQLLALIVARDVLEDAGYGENSDFDRDKIGITLGVGGGQKLLTPLTARLQYPIWKRVLNNCGISDEDTDKIVEKMKKAYIPWEENSFPGMLGNVIAGRVANRLNFGGTNCVLDAACASSLTAVKMGVSELLEHRSELVISGGVDTDNSPFMYLCFSKTPAFTEADKSSPFDESSSGIIIGEGVGMVAMKRLSDAQRDNDKIYAVIKGIGTSSDGKFKSIYAPRPEGQAKALRRAYKDAGYHHSTVDLIEAHGTGTMAGDIAEFTALKDVFSEDNDKKQHIALGSVKSQIGHCKSAAGAAGLIKVALSLNHKILPPTINVDQPSNKMDIENTPFYINKSTRPWFKPEEGNPRRASVSSFGFGGTNFHFTLEEYTGKTDGKFRLTKVSETSVLSAKSPETLLDLLKEEKSSLNEKGYIEFSEKYKIREISKDHARIGFLHNSFDEAISMLDLAIETLEKKISDDAFNHSRGIYYRKNGLDTKGKVVAMFSGQGSQYLEMGKELMYNFPPVMDSFDSMNRIFLDDKWDKLTDVVFPIPKFSDEDKKNDEAKLQRTEFAQPAIGSLSAGMFKILNNAGFEPDYAVGHSFGELTALWAAGVYSEDDFLRLARARGKAMAAPDDPDFEAGTMMAVMGKVDQVSEYLKDFKEVTIANYNSTNQVVVAGPKEDIKKLQPILKDAKFTAIPLPVSAAFHTKLVGHAQKPFADFVKKIKFNKPKIKVSSNSSGTLYPNDTDKIKGILSDHILNSVHFRDQIENIYGDGANIFVEFGPKNVLTKLVENILKGKDFTAISLNANQKIDNDTQLRQAVTQLCVAGLNLEGFDPYGAPKNPPREKGKMSIKINGASYVSEKTQQGFIDALNDGFKVSQAEPQIKEVVKEVIKEVKVEVPVYKSEPSETSVIKVKESDDSVKYFYQHQNETVRAHEQYLENSATYLKTFNEIMGKQFELIKENPDVSISEKVNENLAKFHEHQNETLKVHNLYLKGQLESSRMIIDTIGSGQSSSYKPETVSFKAPEQNFVPKVEEISEKQVFVPSSEKIESPVEIQESQIFIPGKLPEREVAKEKSVSQTFVPKKSAPEKPAAVAKAGLNIKDIENSLLEVVSDKTGYPKEMLELDMDMEGDLGIDSIKRVEILSAIMEKHPELPNPDADTMSALKTLNEVVALLKKGINEKAPQNAPSSTVSSVKPSGDLEKVMLGVVSEKTGYPEEMLELEMDMEGDLGIDSIKRVEIMSAVMEKMPELPQINPDELAELKTLGQIVTIFEKNMANVQTSPQVEKKAEPAAPSFNNDAFSKVMLSVVSEKTGYPEEMLELDMDMEGDLGIDSIKRVEIMSAVMEKFPELPQVNPDDLATLKTLGQIVEAYSVNLPAQNESVVVKEKTQSSNKNEKSASKSALKSNMLKVVSEKTGYPEEMLELDMDMEGDLGIDSIKRVEIMSAVMEIMPELPQVDPDELAQLKTLGQIVDAFSKRLPQSDVTESKPAEVKKETQNVSVDAIKSLMLKVVSDKTGYPVEMLEMDMDMEGDLGIDSIKRVEIMSAVMDEMPELPQVNPDDLAALKTLGQIVEAYGGSSKSESKKPEAAIKSDAKTVSVSDTDITKSMLKIVSEKTGYPEEMLELEMDMEGDLGIDSIKRVEIMSAVMDEHPELPQVNPDELAALKTLGQIIDALLKADGVTSSSPEAKTETKEIVKSGTSVKKAETKIIPYPDFLEFEIPKGRSTLIFDDGGKVAPKLASKLASDGFNPVVLSLPLKKGAKAEKLSGNVKRYTLKDLTEKTLSETLKKIGNDEGAPAGVIYIDPLSSGKNSGIKFSEDTLNRLKTLFLTAKHLKKELCDNLTQRNFFITVTRIDGAFGLENGACDVISGGFAGLAKTLKLEWMNTFLRAVDIDPKTGVDKTVEIIVKELHDPDRRIAEAGYLKKERVTLVAGKIENDMDSDNSIDSSSVFLVSGGAKGVTASCVINLAKKTKAKFILLGRSSFDGKEPSYLKGVTDQAAMKKKIMEEILKGGEKPTPKMVNGILNPVLAIREIKSTIDQIENAGGKAVYLSCDVKDAKSMKKLLKDVVKDTGDITGIVHGAGVLADRFIEDKTVEDFERVLSTKIQGLEAILDSVELKKIKHVALFSSAAGFYGNEGQADYSIANEILNKAAFTLKKEKPELKVCSFNWGPWDGGMVTPELKRMFEEKNVTVIPIDEGCDIFSDHMLSRENVVQVLVGSSMLYEVKGLTSAGSYIIKRELSEEDNRFLEDHVIGGNKVLPTVCATSWMAESCEKLYPGYRFFRCDDYKLYKGIVFDGNHAKDYVVEIEEEGKVNGTVDLNVLISSNGSGKKVNHYGAKITLTGEKIEVPHYKGFKKDSSEKVKGETFYNDGTLFHGPDFQAAGELLNISKDKLTMLCRSPKICEERMGQFPVGTFNPYAADVQFQSMLIWVRRFFDAGSLPSAAKSGIQYKSIPEDKEFYVSMDIVKSSDSSMVADIISHDEDGMIYSMVEGAEVTVSKKLNGLFKKASK